MLSYLGTTPSSREIEQFLRKRLDSEEWIGALPVNEDDYIILCAAVRSLAKSSDGIALFRVPPLTLLSTMVFTARYAIFTDEETPAFYRPYAHNVWGLKEADPRFQAQCRESYRRARTELEATHALYFPHRVRTGDQEVVSGIYTHAILPRYLEDDFAQLLIHLARQNATWSQLAQMPLIQVSAVLTDAATSSRRRLRHFVEGSETWETAARLVQTLADRALYYDTGTPAEELEAPLSPIELSLWHELCKEIEMQRKLRPERMSAGATRKRATSTVWYWNIERHSLGIRVISMSGQSETHPDRLVWAPSEQELSPDLHYADVRPYTTHEGWYVDVADIDGVECQGVVAAVDEWDTVVGELVRLDTLQDSELLFFRVQEEDFKAIQVSRDKLRSGEYLICCTSDFFVTGADQAEQVSGRRVEPVDALRAIGFRYAARYSLELPAVVRFANGKDPVELRVRAIQAEIDLIGEEIAGILEQGSRVFTVIPQVCVTPSEGSLATRSHMSLMISPETGPARFISLDDQASMQGTTTLLDLRTVLAQEAFGRFKLNVLFRSRVISSEHFTVLPPDLHLDLPAPTTTFTIHNSPVLAIRGLELTGCDSAHGDVQRHDNGFLVTWIDPLHSCDFAISTENASYFFTANVDWSHAGILPTYEDGTLLENDLAEAEVVLLGKPYETFKLIVADIVPYEVQLKSGREIRFPIAQSHIKDLLREYEGGSIPVIARDSSGHEWELFTLSRPDREAFDALPDLVKVGVRTHRELQRTSGRKKYLNAQAETSLLTLRPIPHVETSALIQAVSRAVDEAETIPREHLVGVLIPKQYPVILRFSGSPEELHLDADHLRPDGGHGTGTLFLDQAIANAEGALIRRTVPIEASWSLATKSNGRVQVHVSAARHKLRMCSECGRFFVDEPAARVRHSHGNFGAKHIDPGSPESLVFAEVDADCATAFANWEPAVTRIADRGVIRSYRLNRDWAARASQGAIWSAEAYRFAVAEWTLNLGRGHTNQLEALTEDSATRKLASSAIQRLHEIQASSPALMAFSALLQSPEMQEASTDRWTTLDRTMLAAAVTCRALAYTPTIGAELLEAFTPEALVQVIHHAALVCPRLFTWAVYWVETVFLEFAGSLS